MNNKQENRLSMYIAVRDYLGGFLTILTTLPNFQAIYTKLQNIIILIHNAGEHQEIDKSGNTAVKRRLKEELAHVAAETAIRLLAFAKLTKNEVLEKEINFTEKALLRMPDIRLRNTTQLIYNSADDNLTALATYKVTAATQEALQAAIDAFDKIIGKPRTEKVETSKATKQLIAGYKDAESILADLDAVMGIIRNEQVDLCNGYDAVRKVINVGSKKVAIKGMITDAATGEGLKGATISLTLSSNGMAAKTNGSLKPDIIKRSAAKGGFHVINAPDGTYDVVIAMPGFKTGNTKISVVSGQMTVLAVMLEKE